jgi:calcineurin-like phosphoesterase family protein
MGPFRAAHVGDLHFWSFPLNPLALLGKRALGTANLALRRARAFRTRRSGDLAARLAEVAPDVLLFSGDFSTTALPSEFRAARQALEPLLAQRRVLAVPGNHDRYTPACHRRRTFEAVLGINPKGSEFPIMAPLGDGVGLIAIDGSTTNGLKSFGHFRDEDAAAIGRFRREHPALREVWVLCHFPAQDPPGILKASRRNELRNAPALLAALEAFRLPVLYLHGHHHHRWLYRPADRPWVTYVNAGAPFLRRGQPEPDLGFYELVRNGETRITLHRHSDAEGWRTQPLAMPQPGEFADHQRP